MSLSRITGVLLQEYYVTRKSLEVIIDIFYFAVVTIVVYGFFSLYITGTIRTANAYYLILGTVLWEIVRVNQYSISVGALWNLWSRNLSNMFITPLSLAEYMIAHMISSVIKGSIVFITVSLLAGLLFEFNILKLGIANLVLFFINLTLFAWAIGIVVLGLIFRYGTRIQAFAWGLIFLFQPLSATFYPVSILPTFLQKVAYTLPATYVFEASRLSLQDPGVNWDLFWRAFILNVVYFIFSLWFFNKMFNKSKETGQFVRNEG